MKRLVCIVCPNGCHLEIDERTKEVTGNRCPRGIAFAQSELINPQRTLTTSVRTSVRGYPVVSVRTSGEIPKGAVADIIRALKKIVIDDYLAIGTPIIKDILKTNVDIITTTDMHKGDINV